MKFFVVDAPLEDPCSPDAFARCLGLDTYGGGLARGGRPRRSKDPSRRRDRRGGLWNWKSLSLVVGTFLVSYLCWTSRSTRRKAREAGTDGGASAPSSPPTDDITGVGGGEARPFLRLGGLLQGGRSDSSKRRDDLARARGGWGPEPIHKGFDKAIVFDYPLPRVTERDSVSTSCGNHSGVESASTPNPCGDHGHGRLVGSAGEFVGEAERYERGVGDRNAPLWARPSRAELEALVKNQFGKWRTMDDAEARRDSGGHGLVLGAMGSYQVDERSCEPMQQGMKPFKEDDLRRCYDRMRKGYEFGEPLRQVEVVTKGGERAVKRNPRGVVTVMSTSRVEDLRNLEKALSSLSRNFLRDKQYPLAIIHEDFSEQIMERIATMVPVPVHFVKVVFKLPDWMEPLSWILPLAVKRFTGHKKSTPIVGYHTDMHGLLPYTKRSSFGYFHMCRFFSGAGFMLPFFDDFDFYLRLDSDSRCLRPMPDYFQQLQDNDQDYAYDSTVLDFGEKVQGLWNFAEDYMKENEIDPTFWRSPHGSGLHFKALAQGWERPPYPLCSSQETEGIAGEEITHLEGTKIHVMPCHDRHFQAVPSFYTNFEVARIEMLRSTWYQNWFNAIDKTGSFFYSRWGDAPIRFIGLAMHLPPEKIARMAGCRHD